MTKFECWWDYEKMWLIVKLPGGKFLHFTKECLQDMTADSLILNILGAAKAKSHGENIALLCMPRMRQVWHLQTNDSIQAGYYNILDKTWNLEMSQGFVLKIPIMVFEAEKYSHIEMILQWVAGNWANLKNIASFDYLIGEDTCYELGFDWPTQQPAKLEYPFMPPNSMTFPTMPEFGKCTCPACMSPKELHVYDLGDGMLVPCYLANEIKAWIEDVENPQYVGFSSQMIEDDLYGSMAVPVKSKPQSGVAALMDMYAEKVFPSNVLIPPDNLAVKKVIAEMYPGKIIEVNNMKEAMELMKLYSKI